MTAPQCADKTGRRHLNLKHQKVAYLFESRPLYLSEPINVGSHLLISLPKGDGDLAVSSYVEDVRATEAEDAHQVETPCANKAQMQLLTLSACPAPVSQHPLQCIKQCDVPTKRTVGRSITACDIGKALHSVNLIRSGAVRSLDESPPTALRPTSSKR